VNFFFLLAGEPYSVGQSVSQSVCQMGRLYSAGYMFPKNNKIGAYLVLRQSVKL